MRKAGSALRRGQVLLVMMTNEVATHSLNESYDAMAGLSHGRARGEP
jgi:hypothetical protein